MVGRLRNHHSGAEYLPMAGTIEQHYRLLDECNQMKKVDLSRHG